MTTTEPVYLFFWGPAEGRPRVREFLTTLMTRSWFLAIVCSMVGLLSLRHISHILSQLYLHVSITAKHCLVV